MSEVRVLTRGDRNIAWIEKHCIVPDGKDVGKPLKLRSFQRKIIKGIYDEQEAGVRIRRAIVSVGRKNAKTALSACLLLLHLAGSEARPNSELYSTALSRDQAAIIFRLAAKIVRLSPTLRQFISIRDTAKHLFCEELGTLYQALSAEASTAMGLSPVFVVHDELGQVRGPRHSLYEALETATGAQEHPLSIIISTQAPNDADLLSILIDDARAEGDPRTLLFLWEAPQDADPFIEETIRAANPAFGDFQNAQEILDMAHAARRMPAREAEYRNLILNQRVEAFNPFVTQSVWRANGDPAQVGPVLYGGLDLSETNDLTALIWVMPKRGRFDVECVFWLPEEGLAERARKDRVPYDLWHEQGWLQVTPGRSIEYDYVAQHLIKVIEERSVRKVAFDRFNMRHLRPWLLHHGLSDAFVDECFVDFGQGFASMSPALRNLEALLLNSKLRHGNHPVLSMCAANAVVRTDEAGNRKLDKKRSRGRIDGLVALAMAAAVADSDMHEQSVIPVPLESILE